MRPLLVIVGVVALGLLLVLIQPRKDLTPSPTDRAEEQRLAALKQDATKAKTEPSKPGQAAQQPEAPKGPKIQTVMTIKGKGDVAIDLYQGSAPKTVSHIVALINKGFYNGVGFHRVVQDFVIQAGDPASRGLTAKDYADRDDHSGSTEGLGSGGSGENVPFETNGLVHEPGTLGMARSSSKDSGDSQFFINRNRNRGLDGEYCVFGAVTKGMDVVNKVERGDVIEKFVVVSNAAPTGGTKAK